MTKKQALEIGKPHPSFKWNGDSLGKNQVLQLAEDYLHSDETYQKSIGQFLKAWFDESSSIAVQTSGSTGKPRTLTVKKDYMANSAVATGKFFDLPEGTTALLCLPATYIAGKLMIVRALVLGWHLDNIRPQSTPLDQVQKNYDFCAMTPFQLGHSLKSLHLVKKLIVGGGAVSAQLRKSAQGIATHIYETFGMTETLTHIAARRINSKKENGKNPPFEIMKGVKIWQDDRGCLVIEAPNVSDDIIYTNDMVEMQSERKFWLKGRIDNVINSGGLKIHPEEVERKLQTVISPRLFISSLPDDALGEKLILFIESPFSEKYSEKLTMKIDGLKTLDRYEKPKKIYFVEHFEETHTGKIDRKNTLDKQV